MLSTTTHENGQQQFTQAQDADAAASRVTRRELEIALLAKAKAGDEEAFGELAQLHAQKIFQLALTITRNHEDAEDVRQEAFIKAFQNLEAFEGRSQFSTWLTRITVNEALMKLRKRRIRKQVPLEQFSDSSENQAVPPTFEDRRAMPDRLYLQTRMRENLVEAIGQLRPPCQQVFLLREVEEMSTIEAAKRLRVSVTAVKTRLRRAKMQLQETLASYAGHQAAAY